jgi:hypothetical protein
LLAFPVCTIKDVKRVNLDKMNPGFKTDMSKKEELTLLNKNQFMLEYSEEALNMVFNVTLITFHIYMISKIF